MFSRYILVYIISIHLTQCFNLKDILNFDYLPKLFVFNSTSEIDGGGSDGDLGLTSVSSEYTNGNVSKRQSNPFLGNSGTRNRTDGSKEKALLTMNFHRKMMNEYLCRSYLAEEILDITSPRAEDRVGNWEEGSKADLSLVKDSLLNDQGSSNYKDWLTRTATLEDLYKQYESLSNSYPDYDGEVTGYAVQASHQPYNPYAGGGGFQKVLAGSSGFGATTGYGVPSHGGGGGGYGAQTGYSAASIGGGGGGYGGGDSGSKGDVKINLKDLFEIALTAVAFLSFGMFIMNLVMNMMMPYPPMAAMVVSPAAEARIDPTVREKRSAETTVLTDTEALNQMAFYVLNSIDAFIARNKNDECFKKSLCAGNRWSKTLTGSQKIWMPVWSFGISWIAGHFTKETFHLLEYLKASLFGLGSGRCDALFPDCKIDYSYKIEY